ncbi:MAG: hypothetical protein ACYTGQ_06680 [Planctomycetota bacterium]|jgi:hypothetical protein
MLRFIGLLMLFLPGYIAAPAGFSRDVAEALIERALQDPHPGVRQAAEENREEILEQLMSKAGKD